MNEELNEALTNFVGLITSTAEQAYQFGAEQMPDVIEQLLAWNLLVNSALLIASIISAALLLYVARNGFKKDGWVDNDTSGEIGIALVTVCCLLFFFSLAAFNLQWLQILIAPKVWLIEYAASLIK